MANIMVNEACNLQCPYCFAEEFVNKSSKEMTLEDFRKALDFVLGDGSDRQVGIIGGEPLLYTHINEAMRMALSDRRSQYVMIYTNAVELERLEPEILDAKKYRMLVNCNSPEDMGERAFEKMRKNLLYFQRDHFGDGRFRLSVNIYKPDFDYSYVIPLVQEMGFDVIRLSISVPQKGELGGKSPLQYFHDMKLVAMRFVCDMIRCGVITGFDCNFLPGCVLTEEERDSVMAAKEVFYSALSRRYSEEFWQRSIVCEIFNCSPVIDILPDLRAIRCFGLSEYTKRDIRDFHSITALRNHYINTVDRYALNLWSSEECKDCYMREYGECSGGCLLFKAKQLFAGASNTV
ncbi:MAG: radical SAM protein [Clostridiales bacterium]|jgi:MoaA/NifB/PqqE/SkfB family radical SAM enzyme|nr:radical SAM protein [Clostridiales bacterium]